MVCYPTVGRINTWRDNYQFNSFVIDRAYTSVTYNIQLKVMASRNFNTFIPYRSSIIINIYFKHHLVPRSFKRRATFLIRPIWVLSPFQVIEHVVDPLDMFIFRVPPEHQ